MLNKKSNPSVNSQSSTSSTNKSKQLINQMSISDYVGKIQTLFKEYSQLLEQFNQMAKNMRSLDDITDIFEALNYEVKVRIDDSLRYLERVLHLETELIQQINRLGYLKNYPKSDRKEDFKEVANLITQHPNEPPYQVFQEDDDYVCLEKVESNRFYDWVLDIDLLKNIPDKGWRIHISPDFDKLKMASKDGATVAVVGLYDKGKTFVLNHLTQQNLPSSKKVTTKGLSFKHVKMDSGTSLMLIDTAGSYAPVKIEDKLSIYEREITEQFLQDLVFEVADYFICVVNDFTSLDQRYLDRLARNLQHSSKQFKEIIVVHNMKEVNSTETLSHVWHSQVTQIYASGGLVQKTKVAAISPFKNELIEKQVYWFKTQYTRHVCLVNENCSLGMSVNPWVLSLIKYWLKSVFVPLGRKTPLTDSVLKHSELKLSAYLRRTVNLEFRDGHNPLEKILVQKAAQSSASLPKCMPSSKNMDGMLISSGDIFNPEVDIYQSLRYLIMIDLPGVSVDELELYRQNSITIVRGQKRRLFSGEEFVVRQERKYGDFELRFKIPQEYECKWSSFHIDNGVLKIEYQRDDDDVPRKF